MSKIGSAIAKNTSILMTAQLLMWGVSMVWLVVMARLLGPEGAGKLQLANSLWLIAGVIFAFGSDTVLMKEIARNPGKTAELFGSAIVLRLLLFVVGYIGILFAIQLMGYQSDTRNVIYIVGLASLGWLFCGASQAALQGLERMETFSMANIGANVLFTLAATALLLLGWNLYAVAMMMAISAFVNFAIQLYFLRRLCHLQFAVERASILRLAIEGTPYLLSSLCLMAYTQVDVIVISSLLSERAIGWYSVASRLTGTLLFIPTVYIAATFPMFSRMAKSDTATLRKILSRSFDSLLMIGAPIGFGMAILAAPLIQLFFGEQYAYSIPILRIMGIMLILTYQNTLVGRFLISIDRQNIWTVVTAVATVVTLPLDYVIIPWCETHWGNGAMGGAITFVITEACMLITGILLLPAGTLNRNNLWSATRILAASLIMIGAVSLVQKMFIVIPIAVGVITYGGLVLLFRILSKEDFILLRGIVAQLIDKLHNRRWEAINRKAAALDTPKISRTGL